MRNSIYERAFRIVARKVETLEVKKQEFSQDVYDLALKNKRETSFNNTDPHITLGDLIKAQKKIIDGSTKPS